MSCGAKHTAYQPTEAEWRCPKCGADSSGFYIEDPTEEAEEGCELLHEKDGLYCYTCPMKGDPYAASGKVFAAALAKKNNLVCCPTCKGKGTVPK